MLERPSARPPGGKRPTSGQKTSPDILATLPVAAVTAAVWAAVVGLVTIGVLVTITWAVSARGDDGLATPLQATGVVWLVAHHAPVETPAATIALLPMLLLALPLLLLQRAGRWAARITLTSTLPDAGLIVVAGTAAYAAIAMGVAQAAALAGGQVSPLAALAWSSLVGVLGLTLGVVDGAGLAAAAADRFPPLVGRTALVAGAAGASLGVAAGLVAAAALVVRWSTVTSLTHHVAAGAGDAVGLFLVSLAYLPNLVVWALAYVCGPGFAVGGGASIDAFSASGALLPGVPLLGAVPTDAPAAAPLLLLLPVVAGIVAAVVLRRRSASTLLEEVLALLGGAAVVGLGTVVLSFLSGGSLGAARLVGLGPAPLITGLASAGLVAVGGALWSLVVRVRRPTVWVTDRS